MRISKDGKLVGPHEKTSKWQKFNATQGKDGSLTITLYSDAIHPTQGETWTVVFEPEDVRRMLAALLEPEEHSKEKREKGLPSEKRVREEIMEALRRLDEIRKKETEGQGR